MSMRSIATATAGVPAEFEANRYCWAAMSQSAAEQAWTELVGWVQWLRQRYELPHERLPRCWYRHGYLIEELTALMAAWHQAYHYSDDPDLGDDGNIQAQFSSAMTYWHRSFLWPMLTEIERLGYEHRPDEPTCHKMTPEEFPNDMAATITTAIGKHPVKRAPRPQPVPTAAHLEVTDLDQHTDSEKEQRRSRFIDPADIAEAITDGHAEVLHGHGGPDFPDLRFEDLRWAYDPDREDYRSIVEDEPPER